MKLKLDQLKIPSKGNANSMFKKRFENWYPADNGIYRKQLMMTARLDPIKSSNKLTDLNLGSALFTKTTSRGESPSFVHSPWFSSTVGKDIKGFTKNKKFKIPGSYN